MSADNRILIHNDGDHWYVWHGSCSYNYCEPPYDEFDNPCTNLQMFDTYNEADHYAQEQAQGMLILEGGVEILTPEEILKGLLREQRWIEEKIKEIKKQIQVT